MRLLVYGGNQHGERRRIGIWPDEISLQIFQDTYGSSLMSPSFGVGVLDDSPFLILRKIETFGDRAYPLVILLDPARDTWERFTWNGAHLLWFLYGKIDSPGIKLLTDPESFHTDEHLAQLFSTDQGIPAKEESSEITAPECLLDLWGGAVFANSPLVAAVDPEVTGFTSRPDLTGLLALINNLPISLRCGKGWLFGGRERHAEALGTYLVFDDGRLDPPTESEKASVIEFQRQGYQLRTALKARSESPADQELQLSKYLSRPIFEWTADQAELRQFLQDIVLLNELKEQAKPTTTEESNQLFGRVNERLRTAGRLNKDIAAAANRLIAKAKRERTSAETFFTLSQVKSKFTATDLAHLDQDAARSYFIEQKIFPADADGRMPPSIRLRVCQQLLETENDAANIPVIFSKEATSSPGYEKKELDQLLHAAVDRSATLDHGLRYWKTLFEHDVIGASVQDVVQAKVFDEVNPHDAQSIADYLILGADAGGEQLISIKPEFAGGAALETFLQFVTVQVSSSDEPELKQSAESWLVQLAESELRLKVSLQQKDEIASVLSHNGWLNYKTMRHSYKGEFHRSSTAPAPSKQEKRFLAEELTVATEQLESHATGFIPELDRLARLLEPDFLSSMVQALLPLEPDLGSTGDLQWVEGWLHLAQKKQGLDPDQSAQCLSKHRTQVRRLVLETDTPLETELLKELQHSDLTSLFQELLANGEAKSDGFLRNRLDEVLEPSILPKNFRKALREVFDAILFAKSQKETLTRRFVGQQKILSKIQNRLTNEQKPEFQKLFEDKSREEIERLKFELIMIFSKNDQEKAFSRFGTVQFNATKVGDDVFKRALMDAVDELSSDAKLQDSFLSVDASSTECFNFMRKELKNETKQKDVLNALEKRRQNLDHIAKIDRYVMQGGKERDNDYRDSLNDFLKEKEVPSLTINALNSAFRRALSDETCTKTVIIRFIPIDRVYVSGETSLKIQWDRKLDKLFEYLERPIRRALLRQLWKHYGTNTSNNPLIALTREVYLKVEDLKPNPQEDVKSRTKKGKKEKSPTYLNIQDKAIIDFLANTGDFRKRFAHMELGSDKAETIEDVLSEYITDSQEDEPIDEPESNKTKKGRVASMFGSVRAAAKEIFNGGKVRTNEKSQEGDDQ